MCPVKMDIEYCMNTLSPFEKMEVSVVARKELEYIEREFEYNQYEANKARKQRRAMKIVLFIAIILLMLVIREGFAIVNATEYPYTHYDYYVNDSAIRNTLHSTFRKVHDRDGDGEVNCIDYTLTFKQEWDKKNPPDCCEIVRNYHNGPTKRTSMNHLFVRVKMTRGGQWLYIEPQASYDSGKYKMSDFWGWPKYNPKYNVYGETAFWLRECRR